MTKNTLTLVSFAPAINKLQLLFCLFRMSRDTFVFATLTFKNIVLLTTSRSDTENILIEGNILK